MTWGGVSIAFFSLVSCPHPHSLSKPKDAKYINFVYFHHMTVNQVAKMPS